MIKWIYNSFYLENKETLFIISVISLIIIIAIIFLLVRKELKNANK